jgi:hypothetical protein
MAGILGNSTLRMQAIIAPILALNFLNYIPWTIIFLFTQIYGVRYYFLKRREECMRIQKRLQNKCSQTTDGGKGYGYSLGFWYAAFISGESDMVIISLICTEATYKALTKDIEEEEELPLKDDIGETITENKIGIYERSGSWATVWFRYRDRDVRETPRPHQEEVIKAIVKHQKEHRRTVVFLHGPPRTGKSMVGILVANEYCSTLCNTLKPWQPGDTIGLLHAEVEPKRNKPMVIVFDEVDAALMKIHRGVEPNLKMPIAVLDKQGWNHMLDEVQRGMCQDIIIIMTSNVPPETINALDSSYLAPHRVDIITELTETI